MHFPRRVRGRSRLFALVAAALLLRALIPVGYMPGNLLAGEFARLCPVGLAGIAVHGSHDRHATHDGHGDEGESADALSGETCPIGFALKAAALFAEIGLPAVEVFPDHPATVTVDAYLPGTAPQRFRARAPPVRRT